MLDIMPIIKSLWRNKTGPLLIILQLSLTVAVISNALFVVHDRMENIERPSGIAEEEIFTLWVRRTSPDGDIQDIIAKDMEIIRATSGVIDATPMSSIPLSGSGTSSALRTSLESGAVNFSSAIYELSQHGLETLGATLIEGRNFNDSDIHFFTRDNPPDHSVAIITKDFAEKIFPNESTLGKTVFMGSLPLTIIGVVERMMGPWPESELAYDATMIPIFVKEDSTHYLVRTSEGERDSIMHALVEKLRAVDSTRLIGEEKSMAQIKLESYSSDYAMIKILSFVIFLLTFVNALGIIGLTTFWVNQRRKQIGIRRALGSTKAGVVRYFMMENILLVIFAAVVGTIIAYVNSSYMVRTQGASFLPVEYVLITIIFLLLVTLLAAYLPVRKAAQISPVEAVSNV
jgi:putative ABC transport system permease protein